MTDWLARALAVTPSLDTRPKSPKPLPDMDGSKNRGFDGLDHAPVVMSVRSAGWPGNPVFSTLKIA
jgi:hypothetical protein